MPETFSFQNILDADARGVVLTDRRGLVLFVNEKAKNLFAGSPEVGLPVRKLLPWAAAAVEACLENGITGSIRKTEDEKEVFVGEVRPVYYEGRIAGTLAAFRSVEEIQEKVSRLDFYGKLKEQFKALFHFSPDGIWISDGQGVVLDINRAAERNTGAKAAEVVGKSMYDVLDMGFLDVAATVEVLKKKRRTSVLSHIKQTGKTLVITGTPLFDEKGEISLIVVNERDITQLNQIRQELEESRRETEKVKAELLELSLSELKEQEIIAESENMRRVLRSALKLAHIGASNILILGESGAGKGLAAKFIHQNSPRKDKPLIQINCGALPEGLLEAELFGYEKGAFTGARDQGKPGLFELADQGTLFLDEIGELPLSSQVKLLKYLDDREVMRLGSVRPKKVDCTILAAANRDLESLVKDGFFRRDLFHRLNTFTIQIPPLRERLEDIVQLSNFFLKQFNQTYQQNRTLTREEKEFLLSHNFPGNVRELKNLIMKAVVLGDIDNPPAPQGGPQSDRIELNIEKGRRMDLDGVLAEIERDILLKAMKTWRTTREMAEALGVSQSKIVRLLKKHDLRRA